MGRRPNQPRNDIVLSQPTPLIEAALKTKQQLYTISKTRDALPEVPGPALVFRDVVVIGEAAILGWIDRRYPLPSLFPADLATYAVAATLAHALEANPEQASDLYAATRKPEHTTAFLQGTSPNIADIALMLALEKTDPDAAEEFGKVLYATTDSLL